MATQSGIILNRNDFLKIGEEINFGVVAAVRESTEEIVQLAKGFAPVDTGALRASIHAVFGSVGAGGVGAFSGHPGAVAEASALNPSAGFTGESTPTGPYEGAVGIGVDYWIFNEFGTRHMPPHPFITPAVEIVAPRFARRMGEAMDGR